MINIIKELEKEFDKDSNESEIRVIGLKAWTRIKRKFKRANA